MSQPFVSASCGGEYCFCGQPAEHKVEEAIFWDDPTGSNKITVGGTEIEVSGRHPLTRYICHKHFVMIMGPAAKRPDEV